MRAFVGVGELGEGITVARREGLRCKRARRCGQLTGVDESGGTVSTRFVALRTTELPTRCTGEGACSKSSAHSLDFPVDRYKSMRGARRKKSFQ